MEHGILVNSGFSGFSELSGLSGLSGSRSLSPLYLAESADPAVTCYLQSFSLRKIQGSIRTGN